MTAYVAFPCDILSLYKAARFSVPDIIIPSLSAVQLQSPDPSVVLPLFRCHFSELYPQLHSVDASLSPLNVLQKLPLSTCFPPRTKTLFPKKYSRQDPQRVHLPPSLPLYWTSYLMNTRISRQTHRYPGFTCPSHSLPSCSPYPKRRSNSAKRMPELEKVRLVTWKEARKWDENETSQMFIPPHIYRKHSRSWYWEKHSSDTSWYLDLVFCPRKIVEQVLRDAKTHVGNVAHVGGFFHDVILEARRSSFHGLIVWI